MILSGLLRYPFSWRNGAKPFGSPQIGHPGPFGNDRPGEIFSSILYQPQFALFHLLLFGFLASFGNLCLVFFPGHFISNSCTLIYLFLSPNCSLQGRLRDIRTHQKDWPAVAALQVYEFVDQPSRQSYKDCKKATDKVKAWPYVRKGLLNYLETGTLPWDMEEWPLPSTGLNPPEKHPHTEYPSIEELIDIAIYEKQPEKVLHWYDQRPKQRYFWFGSNDDKIATAVKDRFPDRAVDIWKSMAEEQIDQVKPKAYQEEAVSLRKAAKLLRKLKRTTEWERYLEGLRHIHIRKRRLMEILDSLEGKPILRS